YMEDKIIALLTQDKRAFSVYELNDFLGFKTADELKELLKVLNHLEDNLQVYRTNKDKYMLFNNSNLKIGRMIANKKGFGFVDIEGTEDVFIPPMYMNGAIHNDKVIVEIISKKGIELEGRITKIVDRNLKYMVGEISHRNGKCLIKLDDDKIKLDIYLDKLASRDVVDGHKVLVKLTNKLKANSYKGEIIKILGHKNDPGVDILSIVNQLGIPDTFSDEVLSETDCLPDCVLTNELLNRRDLRNEEIFTIDGDDTKDIDDAISIKKMENGYQLGVHIADVSYYVTANSKIDEEAYLRGTSVYLVDRVIPMLPHKLSNGICSLNPNVDRLAISCVMDIDNKGNVINYEIFESVISSKKQMTYNCVNEIYDNNYITKGYEPFVNSLNLMRDLSNILRKSKIERGYIDFDLDESKILIGVDGNVTDVVLRDRGIGQKVIEDFMIIANETVATHISNMELPFIYRVHGQPNENKISEFLRFVSLFGYNINTKLKEIRPKDMQLILDELKDTKEFHIFSKLLLRSMQKALYDY
ncbi:MAG: VacB/RNase II family 3'-5' exoribonuclease, partial [Bacilli bacterium]